MKTTEITSASVIDTCASNAAKAVSQNENKSDFDSYMNKTYSYEDIINMASDTFNVPTSLIKAVIMTESSFNNDSVSYCGATGLMQLMPVAAQELGVSDATDPIQNIMGGTKLLAKFLNKYNGDLSLTLAAYNGGPGNVSKYDGVPPFCEKYVERVTGFMKSGVKVPEKYVTVSYDNNIVTAYDNSKDNNIAPAINDINVNSDISAINDANNTSIASANSNANTNAFTEADIDNTDANPISNGMLNNTSNEPENVEEDSFLTSALKLQMLEAFKNYSDYMRVLTLISDNTNVIPNDYDADEK